MCLASVCIRNDVSDLHKSEIDDLNKWDRLASSYGIDVETMLTLAKSQIKTCASNIELLEDVNKFLNLFTNLPNELPRGEIDAALVVYDGDRSKPYCDLVYIGLCIIREFYKLHDVVSKYKFDDIEK